MIDIFFLIIIIAIFFFIIGLILQGLRNKIRKETRSMVFKSIRRKKEKEKK